MSGALAVAGNRFEAFWRGDGTEAQPYAIHLRVWSETQGFDVTFTLGRMTATDMAAELAGLAIMDSEHIASSARPGVR
jgi:hypothetical protein